MSGPLPVTSVQRRFVLLTGMRWLPVGLLAPVLVLLATERGLSPVDVATVFAVQSVVVVMLELPTGGLADALGRRPVLLLSGALNLAAAVLLALAQDVTGFAIAVAVLGAGRALDSGPLEAWYVDAALAADAGADTTPGLARAGAAQPAGLAVGVVLGGAMPLVADGGLVLPVLVGAGLTAVQVLAVALLVVEPDREHPSALAALRAGLVGIGPTVRSAGTLLRHDETLRRLLLLAAAVGWVLSTIEVVGPLRLVEVTGNEADAAAAFSLVLLAGFCASAVASPLAGPAGRLAGGAGRAIGALYALGALALLGWILGAAVLPAVLAAVAFYAANSASWPLHKRLTHSRVIGPQRATVLSAVSLSLQLGGVVAGFAGAALLGTLGHEAAFGLASLLLLSAGLLALRLPRATVPA